MELVISGRRIKDEDIAFVRSLIKSHFSKGRTFIARELARLWNWRQPNGTLKQMSASSLLLHLEDKGFLQLPPRKKSGNKGGKRGKRPIPILFHLKDPIACPLSLVSPLEIKMVRFTPFEALYQGLIQSYHYLGYCQTVGEHLKYIVFYKESPLACLSFGQAAWKVACRDRFIGWSQRQRVANLYLIAQNTRFLILPWVKIPNLASHILGGMAKILPKDWQRIYNHTIILLETFVDTSRFKGTCYRASNWIHVGFTRGRGRGDTHHRFLLPVKAVFLYPLAQNFKEILTHDD